MKKKGHEFGEWGVEYEMVWMEGKVEEKYNYNPKN